MLIVSIGVVTASDNADFDISDDETVDFISDDIDEELDDDGSDELDEDFDEDYLDDDSDDELDDDNWNEDDDSDDELDEDWDSDSDDLEDDDEEFDEEFSQESYFNRTLKNYIIFFNLYINNQTLNSTNSSYYNELARFDEDENYTKLFNEVFNYFNETYSDYDDLYDFEFFKIFAKYYLKTYGNYTGEDLNQSDEFYQELYDQFINFLTEHVWLYYVKGAASFSASDVSAVLASSVSPDSDSTGHDTSNITLADKQTGNSILALIVLILGCLSLMIAGKNHI